MILTATPGSGSPLLPAVTSGGVLAGKHVVIVKVSVLP